MVVLSDYIRYICDYNQIEMNKLTDAELSSIRQLNQSIVDLKNSISDYEIKKYYAMQQIMQRASELNKLNDEIESKYGSININLETGEYGHQEDISGS